MMEDNA